MRIGCAVLAAGAGSRFGAPAEKLVAAVRNKPLLQHAIDAAAASAATTCSLILGAHSERVRSFVDERRCAPLLNASWRDGMASSIRCAVAAHEMDDACILMLGDQPNVTSADLDGLVCEFLRAPSSIVALRRAGVWGAPVLFGRIDYPALLVLRGDRGAKGLALAQRRRLVYVESARPDAFADVDTQEDLRAINS